MISSPFAISQRFVPSGPGASYKFFSPHDVEGFAARMRAAGIVGGGMEARMVLKAHGLGEPPQTGFFIRGDDEVQVFDESARAEAERLLFGNSSPLLGTAVRLPTPRSATVKLLQDDRPQKSAVLVLSEMASVLDLHRVLPPRSDFGHFHFGASFRTSVPSWGPFSTRVYLVASFEGRPDDHGMQGTGKLLPLNLTVSLSDTGSWSYRASRDPRMNGVLERGLLHFIDQLSASDLRLRIEGEASLSLNVHHAAEQIDSRILSGLGLYSPESSLVYAPA